MNDSHFQPGSGVFLSIQAQDFIEEAQKTAVIVDVAFLSIQAQDFIEDTAQNMRHSKNKIPEHSSSGLH